MYGQTDGWTDEWMKCCTNQTLDSSKVPQRMERNGVEWRGERESEGRERRKERGRVGYCGGKEREKACVSNNSFPSARRPLNLGQKQDKRPQLGTEKGQRGGKTEK